MALLKESYALEKTPVVTSFTVPADRLNDAGQYALAREILEIGAQVHGQQGGILFQFARAYAGEGDHRRAFLLAGRAISLIPEAVEPAFDKLPLPKEMRASLTLQLAWALYYGKDSEHAAKRFAEYTAGAPEDVGALRGQAFALFRLGKYDEAMPLLTRVAEIEDSQLEPIQEVVAIPGTDQNWPIEYNARTTLAWAYLRSGKPKQAAEQFAAALQDWPYWIDALTGMGYAMSRIGDVQGAQRYFRAALLISPGYPDAWQGLDNAGATQ